MLQFIKFGLVGICNTIVSTIIMYICLYFNLHYIPANALGFFAGTVNSYILNSHFVFHTSSAQPTQQLKSCVKTFISYGMAFLLSSGLLIIWIDIFQISKYTAPLINICITTPLNFLFNKFWAFKK
mgnify:CR=1 FL=1